MATVGKRSRRAKRTATCYRLLLVASVCEKSSMVRRGRRFESVRGLCKSPAKRYLFFRVRLHNRQRAVGMEPFVEPSGREAPAESRESARLPRRSISSRRMCLGQTGGVSPSRVMRRSRDRPLGVERPCTRTAHEPSQSAGRVRLGVRVARGDQRRARSARVCLSCQPRSIASKRAMACSRSSASSRTTPRARRANGSG